MLLPIERAGGILTWVMRESFVNKGLTKFPGLGRLDTIRRWLK